MTANLAEEEPQLRTRMFMRGEGSGDFGARDAPRFGGTINPFEGRGDGGAVSVWDSL